MVIRIGCFIYTTYLTRCPNSWNSYQTSAGFKILHLIAQLAFSKNETFEIIRADGFGWKDGEGKWHGLVGDLLREKIDLTPVLAPTFQRSEAIDFIYPPLLNQARVFLVHKRPF